ncbi:MAG: hypothetical protein Q9188_002050, partial [Gyalolechia gomerana]
MARSSIHFTWAKNPFPLLPPLNNNTIYRIASLTKALTSSAVALLVDEGKLAWDLLIREYLPLFSHRADDIGQKTTLKDLLSHRTGLPNADYLFGQQYGKFLMPRTEIVRLTTFLEPVRPFRKRFLYSQWNYGLATEIIETVTGMSLGIYIQDHILKPLRMCRTTLGKPEGENVAIGYALANDGTPHQIDFPNMNDDPEIDFLALAKKARANGLIAYSTFTAAVNKGKTSKLPRLPLKVYEGRYWNKAQNLCLNIVTGDTVEAPFLLMRIGGALKSVYRLEPYDGDTFYWPPDREKELCEK